ncbi:MAG: hypothetical protein IKW09_02375 [Alphaproteobacteria bacterium]|nr:hypothetical protein [Alphaproteobacteria bacterium]
MPNPIVGLSLALGITSAHAATILFANATGGAMSGGTSAVYINPGDNKYYKCTNTFTSCCSAYAAAKITYTSKTGGSGTSGSPYTLTGCSCSGCYCDYTVMWKSSGGCGSSCPNGMRAAPGNASGDAQYHQNTSCSYCPVNKYFEMGYCNNCPNNGYSDNPTTSQGKEVCYLKAGSTFSDEKGVGTCGSVQYWVN